MSTTDLHYRPEEGGDEDAPQGATALAEKPMTVADFLARVGTYRPDDADDDDDGLRWEKCAYKGSHLGITYHEGRAVRTIRHVVDFACVAVLPRHACAVPERAHEDWLYAADQPETPGTPAYEAWHIGTHRRVVIEIELIRAGEVSIPARGESIPTAALTLSAQQFAWSRFAVARRVVGDDA